MRNNKEWIYSRPKKDDLELLEIDYRQTMSNFSDWDEQYGIKIEENWLNIVRIPTSFNSREAHLILIFLNGMKIYREFITFDDKERSDDFDIISASIWGA